MSARAPEPFDEPRFRRWLADNGSVPEDSIDDVVVQTRRVRGMADLDRARTDEHVYMALFGHADFEALDLSARSRLKRAAILFHHFRLSGA